MDIKSMSTEELQEICRQDANNPDGLSWSELEPILAELRRRQRQASPKYNHNTLRIIDIALWVVSAIAAVALLLIVFLMQRPIISR